MKKTIYLAVVIVLVQGAIAMAQAPVLADRRPVDREAIREHIDTIFQAFIHQDREKVKATHATDWRGYLGRSRSTIRGIDEYLKNATAGWNGPRRLMAYEMLEFEVLFYAENVAIVPYIAELTYSFGDSGSSFKGKLRVLDVYAKLNGDWIQVASNTVSHPETLERRRRSPAPVTPELRRQILHFREAVWRAYFTNNQTELEKLIPKETIAIGAGDGNWQHRDEILAASKAFAEGGGKLLHLEFPRTEIQLYRDVAILYTTYSVDFEAGGESRNLSGRGTEIFVRRGSGWVNSGWHLDTGQ